MRIESSSFSLTAKHRVSPTTPPVEAVGASAQPVVQGSGQGMGRAPSQPVDVTDPSVVLTPKQMRDLAVIEETLSRLMAMPVKLRPLRVGPIASRPIAAEERQPAGAATIDIIA